MSVNNLINFLECSKNVDQLPWNYALYIPQVSQSWAPDMPCMVLDPDETDDLDGVPDEAKAENLKYGLTVTAIQDVANNLKNQGLVLDFDNFSKAVKYYFENDAFIQLQN